MIGASPPRIEKRLKSTELEFDDFVFELFFVLKKYTKKGFRLFFTNADGLYSERSIKSAAEAVRQVGNAKVPEHERGV